MGWKYTLNTVENVNRVRVNSNSPLYSVTAQEFVHSFRISGESIDQLVNSLAAKLKERNNSYNSSDEVTTSPAPVMKNGQIISPVSKEDIIEFSQKLYDQFEHGKIRAVA